MVCMNSLCDLLFEFSSTERMKIMNCLMQDDLKLSQISKTLDMTVSEASRHLQRLTDLELINKNVDGAYTPTAFGKLAVHLLKGLDFASINRQYFLEHDVLGLPEHIVDRVGALSNTVLNTDTVRVLAHVNEMFKEAEEYIWVMSYAHSLPSTIPIVEERLQNGVELRRIFPEAIIPTQGEAETISGPCRTLPFVDVRIMMTEKEAMCSPRSIDGKTDYTSFVGKDPRFHTWCRDLYLYYWEKASETFV
ncbi:MAG: ArsR family transcriptional regulator [Candidatus Bathyarchaeota archaeon]|nr:ArsR family transcriptional regulator [Candidatus Bathyarchaeota archaeon]